MPYDILCCPHCNEDLPDHPPDASHHVQWCVRRDYDPTEKEVNLMLYGVEE